MSDKNNLILIPRPGTQAAPIGTIDPYSSGKSTEEILAEAVPIAQSDPNLPAFWDFYYPSNEDTAQLMSRVYP